MEIFEINGIILLIMLYLTVDTQGLSCYTCSHSDFKQDLDIPSYHKSCRRGSIPDKKLVQTCSTGDGTQRLNTICVQNLFEIMEKGERRQIVERKCEYLFDDARMINGCMNRSREEHMERRYFAAYQHSDAKNINWIQICSCNTDQCNGKISSAISSIAVSTINVVIFTAVSLLSRVAYSLQ